jgi:hypothetical protein
MADDTRNTFPRMPVKHWWALRAKFKNSIPLTITPNYIASAFSMSEDSARANVLPFVKMVGLIDENGKVVDGRAKKWRDDEGYKEVCAAIMKEVYPQELIDLASDPSFGQTEMTRWFSNHTGAGKEAVRMMVAFFMLILRADVSASVKESASPSRPAVKEKGSVAGVKQAAAKATPKHNNLKAQDTGNYVPPVHINVQIHIAADATADQIDQIFASMAKHLKIGSTDQQ